MQWTLGLSAEGKRRLRQRLTGGSAAEAFARLATMEAQHLDAVDAKTAGSTVPADRRALVGQLLAASRGLFGANERIRGALKDALRSDLGRVALQ